MKKLMKNTLVIVVLFTALLANANTSLNDLNDVRKTVLTLNDVKQGDELLIKNAYGIILYKETIKNSGSYNKGFDLTELPKGDYFFELNKDFQIKIIPFNVSNNVVAFKSDKETTIFKPSIRNKENKVYINKLSLNLEPLEINVYYENLDINDFELIYSETLEGTNNISRLLNLDIEKKGKYRIETKTEGRTFVDYIQF
ncbi:hypothetical protein KO494_01195 [Lacinutrix sp. C3R15]|uniref:hypothetical protein n=1 Tax=Flavobacteriaceae TaxID=49546 RepID=UPI001C09E3EE|nr:MULTISPECIES: hypothetical protein [Flavobacteriaceae]MBU2938143.1 hypothetical protein [Lacinutrix sp. C3R15]MDO6621457.1 hypothetical protein [Oceanihabitans sp. 1_MG-2023]